MEDNCSEDMFEEINSDDDMYDVYMSTYLTDKKKESNKTTSDQLASDSNEAAEAAPVISTQKHKAKRLNFSSQKNKAHSDIDFEETEESITSGSEYVPSPSDESSCETSEYSLTHLQLPKKLKPQVPNQILLDSDEESVASSSMTVEKKKCKKLKYKCIKKNKSTLCIPGKQLPMKTNYQKDVLDIDTDLDDDSVSDISEELNRRFETDISEGEDNKLQGEQDSESELQSDGASDINLDFNGNVIVQKKSKTKFIEETKTQNMANESISEQSSLDVSLNINLESVGPVMRNKFQEIVLDSSHGCKKNCCFYCLRDRMQSKNPDKKVLYAKLVDHYEKAHKKEYLIDKLIHLKKEKRVPGTKMTKTAKKRLQILEALRLKANHINNLQAVNVKDYVVARRPNPKRLNTVSMYQTCFKCHRRLSEKSIHKHVRKCTGIDSFKKNRIIKSSSRATDGDYHELASENAIKIISVMHETAAVNEIRYDKAVFMWLNAEASAYEAQNQRHNHKRVRANISRLGTCLHEMKKLNNKITEFSDIFHENHYDDLIKAIKIMGKPHPVTKYMQSPATANDMFNLIKAVSEIYDVTIGNKDEKKRLEIQAFERKFKRMWHTSIGNTIAQTQASRRKNMIKTLPSQNDMQSLRSFLEQEITESFKSLENIYSHESYERLRNSLLSYLQFTNCRRPGEVERMEIIDYQNKQIHGDEFRIEVRGKRSRPVPVVFSKRLVPVLDWLILCRPQAKIHSANPYLFSEILDVSTCNFRCVSGCKLMKSFSEQCGASKPATLRATLYRMQLATDQMEKGIDEQGVEQLSGFMGHTPKIHRQNYRQSVVKRDIQIARKVRESQGISTTNNLFADNNINEEEISDGSNEPFGNKKTTQQIESYEANSSEENNAIGESPINPFDTLMPQNSNKKNTRPSTRKNPSNIKAIQSASDAKSKSVVIKDTVISGKQTPWLQPAIDELLERFPNAFNAEYKVPSGAEILDFLDKAKDPLLRMRTEPRVRSYIHSQRKEKKSKDVTNERAHIPKWIYSSFGRHVASKKIPSHDTCARFLGKSPSKNNITIQNIQDWIKKAVQKNSK